MRRPYKVSSSFAASAANIRHSILELLTFVGNVLRHFLNFYYPETVRQILFINSMYIGPTK